MGPTTRKSFQNNYQWSSGYWHRFSFRDAGLEAKRQRYLEEFEKRVQKGKESRVWPNPFYDVINLETTVAYQEKRYGIYDMAGKKIRSGVIRDQVGIIDLSDLSSGSYLLHLKNAAQHFKLIKVY